jgi:plasmid stability protein
MLTTVASRIMRTTLDLDPDVLRELRRRSAREGKSMGQVASELLAAATARDADEPAPDFAWTSADLGAPRIDLEDKEALRRALDEQV